MDCEVCKEPFNLLVNMPMQLPCCNETICKRCMDKLIGSQEQETFQCPITECNESYNCNLSSFKINKAFVKLLEKKIGIQCKQHKNHRAKYYCEDHNILICNECVFKDHKGHKLFLLRKGIFDSYNKRFLQNLKQKHQELGETIEKFENFINNSNKLEPQEYLKIISYGTKILNATLDNEFEKQNMIFTNMLNIQLRDSILKTQDYEQLKSWIPQSQDFKLLYKASRDGYYTSSFHALCDNKGPTISVIENGYKTFGGFAQKSWQSTGQWQDDEQAFVFSLTTKAKFAQVPENRKRALYFGTDSGPHFGDDIVINDKICSSKFGSSYQLTQGVQLKSNQTKIYLTGFEKDQVTEIEVYQVLF